MQNMNATSFRRRLLGWAARHGRTDLPWQRNKTPYRVWVSEIMLQQTQVETVIPYYNRFMRRFGSVRALARADLDEVLGHWSGLGYYARGRNLHKAAQAIMAEHSGRFPRTLEAVMALPGIGRSTAGAILAIAYGEPHAILDGNVKRVLSRVHAITSPISERATEAQLWELAEHYTPKAHVAEYTQAIMDLGATICRARRPDCPVCPLRTSCAANAAGSPERYPIRSRRKKLPERSTRMLILEDHAGQILLKKRPSRGLWGGLWSLPEIAANSCAQQALDALGRELELTIRATGALAPLRHSFTHFHLNIEPLTARIVGRASGMVENCGAVWYNLAHNAPGGLPKPVAHLIEQLRRDQ